MSNVVPMPVGRKRRRHLTRSTRAGPELGSGTTAARLPWSRRLARHVATLFFDAGYLIGYFISSAAAGMLAFICGTAFVLGLVATFALLVLTAVEAFRGWQDAALFTPMLIATAALVGTYVVAALLARGAYRLKHHFQPRRLYDSHNP